MCSDARRAPRPLVVIVAVAVLAGCSTVGSTGPTSTMRPNPATTLPQSTTSTTSSSILPVEGTIPLVRLTDARQGKDLTATAQRALATWRDSPVECYPSKAEAGAARDQFARVATYLAAVRGAARTLADIAAYKEAIALEAAHREFAATRPFAVCNAAPRPTSASPTTTVPGGTTKGLAAGGVVEVGLTIAGDPTVDNEFTVSDPGAPCDGVSANVTFLVSSQDANGSWAISDVIVNADGETSSTIIPTRAGAAAIEYLAYCGTQDKRHGVTTYRVRPTGDTTTIPPPPPTTDPTAPLVVIDLASNDNEVAINPRAKEVAVEPESVAAFLMANDAEGGVVIARLNLGDWVALRDSAVTWVPVGPGTDGLELRIVGAKASVERTVRVTAPSTTTVAMTTTTSELATSTTAPVTATASGPGNGDDTDITFWVIVVLVVVAALTVLGSRLRLRR